MSRRAARPRAREEKDCLRASFGSIGLCVSVRRRRTRQAAAKLIVADDSSKGILYFFSEARTRSRPNIVDPFTTVAGLMPFTRTFGACVTASSRIRWRQRRLAHVVSFAAALGHHRVRRTGEHNTPVEPLLLKELRRFIGQQVVRCHVHRDRQSPIARR